MKKSIICFFLCCTLLFSLIFYKPLTVKAVAPTVAVATTALVFGVTAASVYAAYNSLDSSQKSQVDEIVKSTVVLGKAMKNTLFVKFNLLSNVPSTLLSLSTLSLLHGYGLSFLSNVITNVKNGVSFSVDVNQAILDDVTQNSIVYKSITAAQFSSWSASYGNGYILNNDISLVHNAYNSLQYKSNSLVWYYNVGTFYHYPVINFMPSASSTSYRPFLLVNYDRGYIGIRLIDESTHYINTPATYSGDFYFGNTATRIGYSASSFNAVLNGGYSSFTINRDSSLSFYYDQPVLVPNDMTISEDNLDYLFKTYILECPYYYEIRNNVWLKVYPRTQTVESDAFVIDNSDTAYSIPHNSSVSIDVDSFEDYASSLTSDPIAIDVIDSLIGVESRVEDLDVVINDTSTDSGSSTVDISGLDELAGTYADSVAGVFEPYAPQPDSWLPTFISGLPAELLGLISAMMIMLIIVGAVNRMLG